MVSEDDIFKALERLGLTALEARAYVVLLRTGPSTGYRVAQGIKRSPPNAYRLIESLVRKGLVEIEDGEKRLCRAVPYRQMLDLLGRRFEKSCKVAADALAGLEATGGEERVYRLGSRWQVLERCRAVLGKADQLVLVDAFPDPLEELTGAIEEAARRGVEVVVKAYRPIAFEGAEVIVDYRNDEPLDVWDGHWLNLVSDGREYVLSFLDADGRNLHLGVWSNSAYLSWIYHGGLASEMALDQIRRAAGGDLALDEIRRILERYRPSGERFLGGHSLKRRKAECD